MSEELQKLTELFIKFPGIGPRQAKRFVYFLLNQPPTLTKEIATRLSRIHSDISQCKSCFRYFPSFAKPTEGRQGQICDHCADLNVDEGVLIVVEKDIDLDALKKLRGLSAKFFVLGGLIPILEKESERKVRIKELEKTVKSTKELKEIILAFSANPGGDHTIDVLREMLYPTLEASQIKLSILGRGLSTGTELEYSDSDTLESAFQNRS